MEIPVYLTHPCNSHGENLMNSLVTLVLLSEYKFSTAVHLITSCVKIRALFPNHYSKPLHNVCTIVTNRYDNYIVKPSIVAMNLHGLQ